MGVASLYYNMCMPSEHRHAGSLLKLLQGEGGWVGLGLGWRPMTNFILLPSVLVRLVLRHQSSYLSLTVFLYKMLAEHNSFHCFTAHIWVTTKLGICEMKLTLSALRLASLACCSQASARSMALSFSSFIACIFFLMASMAKAVVVFSH